MIVVGQRDIKINLLIGKEVILIFCTGDKQQKHTDREQNMFFTHFIFCKQQIITFNAPKIIKMDLIFMQKRAEILWIVQRRIIFNREPDIFFGTLLNN